MKYLLMFFGFIACTQASSADYANPYFIAPLPVVHGSGLNTGPSMDSPLPQAFTENKSIFDMLEVIGRGVNFAILRYPMIGTSMTATPVSGSTAAAPQGISYRELIVKTDKQVLIGGRSFKVILPAGETNVQLANDKNGHILWEGDLSGPKVYNTNPNVVDYQYTPPTTAGTGIGQTSTGSVNASQAATQSK
jgi:hypothetical protein